MTRWILRLRGDKWNHWIVTNCYRIHSCGHRIHLIWIFLFHNPYTFESDLNTHNPEGLTEVQLCWINVNEPQKLYRMSLIRWGSRFFQVKCFEWLMWLKVIMNWLVSLITQASQEKVIKSALLSFESQLHVFFLTRLTMTPVTLCDMWYSPLFHSSWVFTIAIKA